MNQETHPPNDNRKDAKSDEDAEKTSSETVIGDPSVETKSENSGISIQIDKEDSIIDVSASILEFKGKQKGCAPKKLDIENIIVADNSMSSPATLAECSEWLATTLPERAITILKLSYGVEDGRRYSYREIGGEVSLSHQRVGQILNKALAKLEARRAANEFPEGINSVCDLFNCLRKPRSNVSLGKPTGSDKDGRFKDSQENMKASNSEGGTPGYMSCEKIDKILDLLSDREKQVIKLRYGLEDGHSRTLEEVGKKFNVSRGRIHQIEMKAIKKLTYLSRRKRLFGLLELCEKRREFMSDEDSSAQ